MWIAEEGSRGGDDPGGGTLIPEQLPKSPVTTKKLQYCNMNNE